MVKKPKITSHKSRFEILEARQLLTTFNVADPMTGQGTEATTVDIYTNSGSTHILTTHGADATYSSSYGGEEAYGSTATKLFTSSMAPSGYLNSNGGGVPQSGHASDLPGNTGAVLPYAYAGSPGATWDYGLYDSGPTDANSMAPVDNFGSQIVPGTFDSYGANSSNAELAMYGRDADGGLSFPGIAGWVGQHGDDSLPSAVQYVYGNGPSSIADAGGSLLNGDGTGLPVPDINTAFGGEPVIVDVPAGTFEELGVDGPNAERFTAPTTGSYTITATFTDPFFDPFNGQYGANGNEQWTWDDGQPDWIVIQNSYNSTAAGSYSSNIGSTALDNDTVNDYINQSVPLASAQNQDVAYDAGQPNHGSDGGGTNNPSNEGTNETRLALAAEAMTTGSTLTGSTVAGSSLFITNGTGVQNGSNGTGGTWVLKDVGPIAGTSEPGDGYAGKFGDDITHDEYDMTWTVTKTVALKAGDSLDLTTWARPDGGDPSGSDTAPSYLAAAVSTSGITAAPVISAGATSSYHDSPGTPVSLNASETVSSGETDLTSATVSLGASYVSGDTLSFTSPAGSGLSATYSTSGTTAGTLTIVGSATPGQYQAALQSLQFSTTNSNLTTRSVTVNVGEVASNTATDTINVTSTASPAAPVVTAANPNPTVTVGGAAATVDGSLQVSSLDANITGASLTITNYQAGDTLNYSTTSGVTEGTPVVSGGSMVVPFTGNVSAASYQAALRTVTFSTSGTTAGTRTIDVVATDSTASPTTSNTGVEDVTVVAATIGPPVVTAHQSSVNVTAGAAVTVDGTLTVTSPDTTVTGATITLGTGYTTGDTLNYATTAGVTEGTPVISGGSMVVPFTGNVSAASYQAALRTVTFSNTTSNSLTTRNVTIAVQDSNDTGSISGSTSTQITLSAPLTISQLYVNGTAWTNFDTYLGSHGYSNSSTLGYQLLTGSSQLTTLPWSTINEFEVSFSGTVGTISASSFKLVGGTGGTGGHAVAAPTITSVTEIGSTNTYTVALSASLSYNDYILAVAGTGSSFGPAVKDPSGAAISGKFTTSSSTFPSGNGISGSTFDFQIDVLPGDANQNGTVNTQDTSKEISLVNDKTSAAGYIPFVDINANATINSLDNAVSLTFVNDKSSAITAPTAPAASQVGGTGGAGFTALALGVLDTSSSSSSSSTSSTASNVVPASTSTSSTSSTSTSSTSTDSSGSSSSTSSSGHGRHKFAANDEAVGQFDLADLFI